MTVNYEVVKADNTKKLLSKINDLVSRGYRLVSAYHEFYGVDYANYHVAWLVKE